MTGEAVIDLAAIRGGDTARVGPKMARLGQLAADGYRVPDGYAVTAQALDGWLPAAARGELARMFSAPVSGHAELAELAARARALVDAQPLPSRLADAVAAAHRRLVDRTGHGPGLDGTGLRVAVRSSAVSEDGHAASFAGQYETYLGVSGVEEVLLHIRRCWASGFSAPALAYRSRFGGPSPLRAGDLAVGVLELVDARSAGVAFTLDPITGDRATLVVEGNWGLGESVVSGHVTPDHWTVDRASGQVLTARAGAKRAWTAYDAAAGRAVLAPLPDELTGQACLTDEEVRYICAQAVAIETAAGGVPQDVEWAVARDLPFPDSVFFLQHRPETTWAGGTGSAGTGSAGTGSAGTGSAGTGSAGTGSAGTGPGSAPAPPEPEAEPAFDPVQYALRNVFKVPKK